MMPVDARPVEVVRVEDHALPVDHAGRADADAEDRPAGRRPQLPRPADGEVDRRLAAGALAGHLAALLHLPQQVDHGPGHPVVG
ncbi:MAG TPA: hypothetical protein VFO01_00345 [Trebonia sp.]|nr:hypothetical protein [Trebonia sp.]